jgi:acyl carrier protein
VGGAAMMLELLRDKLAARLGLAPLEIDPKQPFACYGLDSLTAVQLADELSGALQCTIAPTVFWDHPSVAQLAQFLADETVAPAPPAEPAARERDGAEPIAIIGMGCRFPGANGIDAFWAQGKGLVERRLVLIKRRVGGALQLVGRGGGIGQHHRLTNGVPQPGQGREGEHAGEQVRQDGEARRDGHGRAQV